MKYLITKEFENTPGEIFQPGDVLELWPDTGRRAVKEKAAVPIPEGVDIELYKESIFKKNK